MFRFSTFATVVIALVAVVHGDAHAQIASHAPGMGGMHPGTMFSPVTGSAPMSGGYSAQQQMAQAYMLYGMMGGAGGGGVRRGPANPFVNGGYGMGSLPSLDNATSDVGTSSKHGAKNASAARKAEIRAQRAEQKKQAKLAKTKTPSVKASSKTKSKKDALP